MRHLHVPANSPPLHAAGGSNGTVSYEDTPCGQMLPLSNRDPSFLFSPQTDELQKRTFPGVPIPRERPAPTNATVRCATWPHISTLITGCQQYLGTFEIAPWFIRSAPPCDAGSPATLPLTGPSVVVCCRVLASLRLIPCIAAPHHGRALILLLPLRSPTCAVGLSSGCFLPPR